MDGSRAWTMRAGGRVAPMRVHIGCCNRLQCQFRVQSNSEGEGRKLLPESLLPLPLLDILRRAASL